MQGEAVEGSIPVWLFCDTSISHFLMTQYTTAHQCHTSIAVCHASDPPCPCGRYGATLEDSTQFDAKLFSLSDAEASLIDPQQRMLTETTFDAVMAQFGTASGISGAQQRYGNVYVMV